MQSNIDLSLKGTKATISLNNGAAITSLSVQIEGAEKTLMMVHPNHRFENAWLFPFPNRLKNGRFEFEGNEYQFPLNDNDQMPNALHGFLSDQGFEVITQSESHCDLRFEYPGDLAYYPFPCTINIRYELVENGLKTDVTITNQGLTKMPFGLGWHPYFHFENGVDDARLKMPECTTVQLDELGIPKGVEKPSHYFDEFTKLEQQHLDNCYRTTQPGKNMTEAQFNTGEILQVWQNGEYPFIQVYTHPERKSLAIEPMSCAVNALNSGDGLTILSPNESKQFTAGFKLIPA
jgi:aldose 1-epimerase